MLKGKISFSHVHLFLILCHSVLMMTFYIFLIYWQCFRWTAGNAPSFWGRVTYDCDSYGQKFHIRLSLFFWLSWVSVEGPSSCLGPLRRNAPFVKLALS